MRLAPFRHHVAELWDQAVTHCPARQSLCTWMTRPASAWPAASPRALLAVGAIVRRTVRASAVGVATTRRAGW